MARLRGGTAKEPAHPARTRWVLVAAVAAVPALLLIWLVTAVVRFSAPDDTLGRGPREVPCARALEFGGARLPAGAHDTRCTVRSFQDTLYRAEFRMPRTAVRDWLERTYPQAGGPKTEFCAPESADLCLGVGFLAEAGDYAGEVPGAAQPGFGAAAARVSVEYEGPDTALVRFEAFDM
ncbi:hypothetical protein [Streptomyces sp. NPDC006527]|uniref:hypothetical protein n=1 Tax=Streptomyces sp. NPDC006527 TaxID=3364749 RepID=UPI0036A5A0F9